MQLKKSKFIKGDLVKRMIASHYTNGLLSDAMGVVLRSHYPIARVYFYDTNKEEVWNEKVLELISRKLTVNDD
tara:strand:- start:1 stop:219 length:219 start_codon:yes stop_codon:yes gene_type:complete